MLDEYSTQSENEAANEPPPQPGPPPTPTRRSNGPSRFGQTGPRDQTGAPGQAGPRSQAIPVGMPDLQPRFTAILLGLIVLVYLAGQIITVPAQFFNINGVLYPVTSGEDWLFFSGAKINELILGEGQYYRLLTMMFLHADLIHLAFNGYALWIFGQTVERFFGHGRFLAVYFLGGLTASVASLLFSSVPSVGASGAIFAIFGAEIVFIYQHRKIFGVGGQQRLNNLLFVLGFNMLIGFTSTRIDNWAHIGGLVAGAALTWLIGPQFSVGHDPGTAPQPEAPQLVDGRPSQAWAVTSVLWTGGLILVVGLMALAQG